MAKSGDELKSIREHIATTREHLRGIANDLAGPDPVARDRATQNLADFGVLHGEIGALIEKHTSKEKRANAGRLA